MAQGAFRAEAMSGPAFVDWLDRAENFHRVLMRESKLMASAAPSAPAAPPPSKAK
jgi:hypothetical protein